ncbi:VC0807 family protein [Acidiphilium sp.]|uniref:VC0807 family protein n=1 Tax=Acidiphilium sp. TaxID=527 RepID=UPI003CFD3E88
MTGMITRKRLMMALEILFNFLLPWVVYRVAKPHLGEIHAIMASAAPPMLWSLIEFARKRRVDAISVMVLGGIGLSLLGFALGGSPKLLLMRESLITGLIGVVFIVSALIGRPLMYVLASASLKRRSAEDSAEFEAYKDDPAFRRMMAVMTLVWGVGFVAETAVRSVLVFSLPVGRFLIIGPVVGYTTVGLLMVWTFLYGRRAEKRGVMS